ncbi:hypothetical protein F2P56_011266 [Juglans regia]|uniref:Secoisolariciresinol dehydrogenase-like n=1 Tax=Juglans regia TaxID=51240 RepID=A0A833XL55_JUGRE|nr:hypothetical protein F2P56_011266 [Juglans regia]
MSLMLSFHSSECVRGIQVFTSFTSPLFTQILAKKPLGALLGSFQWLFVCHFWNPSDRYIRQHYKNNKKLNMNSAASSLLAPIAKRLAGKVALITGGASGIGESSARLFAQHGAKVVIADVQDELGLSICDDKSTDGAVSYVHCDVTNEPDVKNAVDTAVSKHGKLDIMFNNAGYSDPETSDICALNQEEYKKVFGVNVLGSLLGAKHAAKVMIPEKKGTILFTSSSASISKREIFCWYDKWRDNSPLINEMPLVGSVLQKVKENRLLDSWDVDLLENLVGQDNVDDIIVTLSGANSGNDVLVWTPTETGSLYHAAKNPNRLFRWDSMILEAQWIKLVAPKANCCKVVKWLKPPPRWCKLNTDGSSLDNPGSCGIGGVIHNYLGRLAQAFAYPIGF